MSIGVGCVANRHVRVGHSSRTRSTSHTVLGCFDGNGPCIRILFHTPVSITLLQYSSRLRTRCVRTSPLALSRAHGGHGEEELGLDVDGGDMSEVDQQDVEEDSYEEVGEGGVALAAPPGLR